MHVRVPLCFFVMLWALSVYSQHPSINPELLKGHWPAYWITCPDVPQRDYGVYHFRKTFNLESQPDQFIIHVSADNRYRLFVNGLPVSNGPARGDLYNWYFETVDIATHLQSGENLIAAVVWNMGVHAPVAQVSNQTAFVVQGNTEKESMVNTDQSWKVIENKSYEPCSTDNGARLQSYMVVGPGDRVRGGDYPWGWKEPEYDDSDWQQATQLVNPAVAGYGTDNLWTLTPRTIPFMEETPQRIPLIRRTGGIPMPEENFLDGTHPLTIPANTTATILLDQTHNTTAYPELVVSGGKGATKKLTYAEALFNDLKKGNRDVIAGKEIKGNYDIFIPDGGEHRLFRPLWFRTYRYMQVAVTTANDPLIINDLYGMYTGYPFEEKASFSSNDSSLQKIWDVGWRTARLCAGETYYDCPYYEQLQYEGDSRIQSLISLYVTGDDRLMRKAINDFYHSRVPAGLTQGRYPSNRLQVIPPFSLYWVSMVYDYWMHRRDDKFIKKYLTAIEGVLAWYETHIDQDMDMLGPMKWWNFVDWNRSFPNGVPDGAIDGNSSVITLQYAYTLRQAAALFAGYDRQHESERYSQLARQLASGTYKHCFDDQKGVMANTPERNSFSQHASIMGILAGSIPKENIENVMQNILHDTTLSQATFYYRFYLTRALKKTGMADLYYSQLTPWRDMLAIGLTTFAENPEPTRSDCHAWSASPNYDFLATICGIMPSQPGFREVQIKPALGALKEVHGEMPHPDGSIIVSIKRQGKHGVMAEITLPEDVSGTFEWNGETVALKGGSQKVSF